MTHKQSCSIALPPRIPQLPRLISCLLFLLLLPAGCTKAPPTPTPPAAQSAAPEADGLQGYWEGDGPPGKISITITGNTLRYVAEPDTWYETTFTIPAAPGTAPAPGIALRQLHATITGSSEGTNSIGDVVIANYKIEDGTLTLAVEGGGTAPTTPFAEASSLYILKKVEPQETNADAITHENED